MKDRKRNTSVTLWRSTETWSVGRYMFLEAFLDRPGEGMGRGGVRKVLIVQGHIFIFFLNDCSEEVYARRVAWLKFAWEL